MRIFKTENISDEEWEKRQNDIANDLRAKEKIRLLEKILTEKQRDKQNEVALNTKSILDLALLYRENPTKKLLSKIKNKIYAESIILCRECGDLAYMGSLCYSCCEFKKQNEEENAN